METRPQQQGVDPTFSLRYKHIKQKSFFPQQVAGPNLTQHMVHMGLLETPWGESSQMQLEEGTIKNIAA